MRQIGPYSRANTLMKMDGRSAEVKLLRSVTRSLVSHVGGSPSATQEALINRAAWLTLHLATMDRKIMSEGGPSERDSRQYLAWSNSLSRLIRQIGIVGATSKPPSLDELLASRRAAS